MVTFVFDIATATEMLPIFLSFDYEVENRQL